MVTRRIQRKKKILFDLILIAFINVLCVLAFIKYDLFELIYDFSREYEGMEIDELFPLAFIFLFTLIYFFFRRWRDSVAYLYIAEQQATKDSLTKLFNRRVLERKLNAEWDRFLRYHDDFCVVLFDIDDFSDINDSLGYVEGDRILIEIAELLSNQTRKTDICSRWGEEEFLILCPVCKSEQATILAEKLRSALYRTLKDGIELSASFSVVQSDNTETLDDLIKRVHLGLHRAKQRGKNCVVSG